MSEVPLYPPTLRVGMNRRTNVAHVRQSRPDYGLGFQVQVRQKFKVVPFPLGSGTARETRSA